MRRGYTLIEMLVVITVLMLISVIAFPAVTATIHANQRRAFVRGLENLTLDAHNIAVTSHSTVTLQVDSEGRFSLQGQSPDGTQTSEFRSIAGADGLEPSKFVLTGREVGDADWVVNFYPDGSSDAAGVELSDNKITYSINIDPLQGRGTLASSELPEATQERWEAGDYVHRS